MKKTEADPEFHKHLETAKKSGVSYGTYWARCFILNWRPERAATMPPEVGRRPSPDSIRSKCAVAGINRRRYYDIKEHLDEMEASYTVDDIIEIAVARKRGGRHGS